MKDDPEKHDRRSIRLKEFDYSRAGAYFVTICAQGRKCLFGDVAEREMRLNDAGRMVRTIWEEMANRFSGLKLDAFMVMPNHVHGIIILVGAGLALPDKEGAVGAGLALPDKEGVGGCDPGV